MLPNVLGGGADIVLRASNSEQYVGVIPSIVRLFDHEHLVAALLPHRAHLAGGGAAMRSRPVGYQRSPANPRACPGLLGNQPGSADGAEPSN